jgi:hypothetical protein
VEQDAKEIEKEYSRDGKSNQNGTATEKPKKATEVTKERSRALNALKM